jgi:AhpC/TSA family
VILSSPAVDAAAFERATGWALKPEGACRDDACVPLRNRSLAHVARRLGMPLVHDREEGLWSLGPEAAPVLDPGARAPDFELPDLEGRPHRLSDLRGRKVMILAWAPW